MGAQGDLAPLQLCVCCSGSKPMGDMAFNVLFGSRLISQTVQRSARPVAVQYPSRAFSLVSPQAPKSANLVTPVRQTLLTNQNVAAARCYGTRSVWNVKSGNRSLFLWFVVATAGA